MSTQRASAFRERMAQANTRPNTTAPTASADEPVASTPKPSPPPHDYKSKFSVLFDNTEAIEFDRLVLDIRALLGRRATKGDVIRALVALAADDATLRSHVADELHRRDR